MKRLAIIVLAMIFFTAGAHCEENKAVNKSPFSFLQGCVMGDDFVQYQSELTKIDESYKKGEITKEKCIEMKEDARTSYEASKI